MGTCTYIMDSNYNLMKLYCPNLQDASRLHTMYGLPIMLKPYQEVYMY